MKTLFKNSVIFILLSGTAIYFPSCKKDASLPIVTTYKVSDITETTASTGGTVKYDGGAEVTDFGVCWSTTPNPTTSSNKISIGTGSGTFSGNITGLTANTTYHVRAYATNSVGTAYGLEISFSTLELPPNPEVTTSAITSITSFSAISGGTLLHIQRDFLLESGLCWSISRNPTINDNKTINETGELYFTSNLTVLTQGTTYYLRAYAIYGTGFDNDILYGNEQSFTTDFIVITTAIVSFTSTSAVVTGNIIFGQNGNHLIGSGVCWSTLQNPTTDDIKTMNTTYSGIFSSNLAGLLPGTVYFVRAYAVYDNGPTIYGNELRFATSIENGTGTQKADYPGEALYNATGFSIGTKIYIGLGFNSDDNPVRDFWEWDQASNGWARKTDYPGRSSFAAVGFSIGTKGYIGAGYGNEFWEFDPSTNNWTQKSSLPGTWGRIKAVGFSIGAKGYIGTGSLSLGNNSESSDFWEWDQVTNVWTKKADFGGIARTGAVGFSIGNKGYIGTGSGQGTTYNDFWEWDQETNVWTRKNNFSGNARTAAIGFSIGNKGYIGTGSDGSTNFKDFWEWDQATNVWIKKADFEGKARLDAVGFSIGNKGYIGMGWDSTSNLNDLWEYNPNLK